MSSAQTPSAARVVIVGSSNTDLLVQVERIPKVGETVIGGTFSTAGGGKGANQAVAAVRAGAAVTFVGRVGQDAFGKAVVADLTKDGIDLTYLTVDPKSPSGVAFIFIGGGGENSIAVASGANLRLSPADVRKARGAFRAGAVLLVQLEAPLATVTAAVELARKSGMTVILNPAPAQALPAALLRQVDLLTPNEHEAETLTGIPVTGPAAAAQAAAKLQQLGVKTVVITLGAQGAFVAGPEGNRMVAPFAVKAVDTTGAGDVFSGALAYALAARRPLLDAVRFGQAAAALSVTRLGAQPSAPRRTAIERLLKAQP